MLWRHDVDYSVHRAVALARARGRAGARATYFVSLHSDLYNVLEPAVHDRLREIAALGHWIGLHFDAGFYADGTLDERAAWEGRVLAEALEVPVEAVSLHNPSVSGTEAVDVEVLGGMVHAGARSVRDTYAYVSDSNGYWRFERLAEMLAAGAHERLHVLTHPEWWQEEPMSPRERILRCIDGRGARRRRRPTTRCSPTTARQRRAAGPPLRSAWMIDSPCGASKSCGISSIPAAANRSSSW